MSVFNEKEQAFLVELEALTRKHGLYMGGCGCCGSPWLFEFDDPDETVVEAGYGTNGISDITWLSPADTYYWENKKHTIVKKVE